MRGFQSTLIFLTLCMGLVLATPVHLYRRVTSTTVQHALDHCGEYIGQGAFGYVFELPEGFNSQPAVVKIMHYDYFAAKSDTPAEIAHLQAVEQLIAWGQNAKHQVVLVMKNMGMRFEKAKQAGLSEDLAKTLRTQAQSRYMAKYGMQQQDGHNGNYVYRKAGATWVAEMIDWDNAKSTKSLPKAMAKQELKTEDTLPILKKLLGCDKEEKKSTSGHSEKKASTPGSKGGSGKNPEEDLC